MEQGKGRSFSSPSLQLQVNSCADFMFVPSCVWAMACTQICAHVKDIPYPPVVKELAGARREEETSWVTLYYGLAFPGESSQNCPCVALGQERYLI